MKQLTKIVTFHLGLSVLLLQVGCTDVSEDGEGPVVDNSNSSSHEKGYVGRTEVELENIRALAEADRLGRSGATERTKVRLTSLADDALFRESLRLTAKRRNEFHNALAERLNLSGETREAFVSILDEAQAERLKEVERERVEPTLLTKRSTGRFTPSYTHNLLLDLLGKEKHNEYMELRETRRDWYVFSRDGGKGVDKLAPKSGRN